MEPDALDRLAIEFICAFGMPPVDFVRMATSLDVSRIGMAPAPITATDGPDPCSARAAMASDTAWSAQPQLSDQPEPPWP